MQDIDSDEDMILNMDKDEDDLLQVPIPILKSQSTKIKGIEQPVLKKKTKKYEKKSRSNSAKSTQSELKSKEQELDMVFLFADPLVVNNMGKTQEYIIPLDLDTEYNNIVNNLYRTGKEFRLKRMPFSVDSLQDIMLNSPKILHISCHGSFKETEKGKKFFISIEDKNGIEN